jgi:hypothetical protein
MEGIIYHAYQSAAGFRGLPPLPHDNYKRLYKVTAPDLSARDNNMLANSATGIAHAMQQLEQMLHGNTNEEFKRLATDMVLTFAGEIPEERDLSKLIKQPPPPAPQTPLSPKGRGAGGEGQ